MPIHNYSSFATDPIHAQLMEEVSLHVSKEKNIPTILQSEEKISTLNQLVAFSHLFYHALHTRYLFCFSVSREGIILDMTENIEKILGYLPEHLIGDSALSFVENKDRLKAMLLPKKTLVDGKSYCAKLRLISKQKECLLVKIFTVPMDLLDKNKIYLMGVPFPCSMQK